MISLDLPTKISKYRLNYFKHCVPRFSSVGLTDSIDQQLMVGSVVLEPVMPFNYAYDCNSRYLGNIEIQDDYVFTFPKIV